MQRLVIGAAAAALLGCSPPGGPPPPDVQFIQADVASEKVAPDSQEAPVPEERSVPGAPMLAYAHSALLQVPKAAVAPMRANHEAACRAAGPARCLVVGSTTQSYDDATMASLEIRAAPDWIETFLSGLETQAEAADGRVAERSVTAEDLTRAIVDTQARLRALETLRGRLEGLLRDRPGKLADLLDLERELARVQGELDATKANLAVMQERVAMSRLTLSYQSEREALRKGVFQPISDAFADFFHIVAQAIAWLIRLVAVALPLALVAAPVGWLIARLWRKRRKRASPEDAAPS